MKTKLALLILGFFSCPLNVLYAQCTRTVDTDNFSNASAWTSVGAGNVTVSNGACTFVNAVDAVYDRIQRPLASTLSDTYFKAEFKFTINGNPSGYGVGTNLLALTAGTLDAVSYDGSMGYALTNQDGFIVELVSANATDNDMSHWLLSIDYKDGATRTVGANTILLTTAFTYYVVFERTSATSTRLSVYFNAAHTVMFGQVINTTVATVTGLNNIQLGVSTFGSASREFNGTVDDVVICDDLQSAIGTIDLQSTIHVYPNPSQNGQINLDFENSDVEMVLVYNGLGQVIQQFVLNSASKNMEMELPSGIYSIVVIAGDKRAVFKQVVE